VSRGFPVPCSYRHRASGRDYWVVRVATLQCSTERSLDGRQVVIYRPMDDGSALYARLREEFDERFEPVAPVRA
jgi:hypothetical protein